MTLTCFSYLMVKVQLLALDIDSPARFIALVVRVTLNFLSATSSFVGSLGTGPASPFYQEDAHPHGHWLPHFLQGVLPVEPGRSV